MKQMIIVFTFPMLIAASIPSVSGKRTKREEVTCTNPVPEFERMQFGYDVTVLDIFNCPQLSGIRNQLFDYIKCGDQKEWIRNKTEEKFIVPDVLKVGDVDSNNESTFVYDNWDAWLKQFKSPVEIEQQYMNGLMASSDRGKLMQSLFLLNGTRFAVSLKDKVDYKMEVLWNDQKSVMTPSAQKAIDDLPSVFNGSEVQYIDFIKEWGTHFVLKAEFGEFFERTVPVEDNDVNFDKDQLMNKWKELFPMSNDSGEEKCNNQARNAFVVVNKQQNSTELVFGGNANDFETKEFQEYWETITRKPMIRRMELKHIASLIEGPKSVELEMAVKAYISKATLQQKIRSIELLLESGSPRTEEINKTIEEYYLINTYGYYDQSVIDKQLDRAQTTFSEILEEKEKKSKDENGAANGLIDSSNIKITIIIGISIQLILAFL